jgi:hypothetical protein
MNNRSPKHRKWLYPILYIVSFIISMLPLYTQKPYAPRDTQNVILSLLIVATAPYHAFAPIFHIATTLIIALIFWKPKWMGRILSGYMALNYFIISFVLGMGTTEQYGFVIHTGGMIMYVSLGILWLITAIRNELQTSFSSISRKYLWLLPFALLSFWSPYVMTNNVVYANFNPLLFLSSPDYGLTFCFTTPVFMFLLILFYPHVNQLAFRITAFNGFLYGIFNLSHWFKPEFRWMGFLHLPLLLISGYALFFSMIHEKRANMRLKLT